MTRDFYKKYTSLLFLERSQSFYRGVRDSHGEAEEDEDSLSYWPLTIGFSVGCGYSLIRALSGATTQGQTGHVSDGNKGVPHSPKLHHHWSLTLRLFRVISKTLIGGVLLLCRDAVCVFFSPSRLGHKALVERILLLFRDAVCLFYSLSRLGHKARVERVLPLCRNAVSVLCSPSRLDHIDVLYITTAAEFSLAVQVTTSGVLP